MGSWKLKVLGLKHWKVSIDCDRKVCRKGGFGKLISSLETLIFETPNPNEEVKQEFLFTEL